MPVPSATLTDGGPLTPLRKLDRPASGFEEAEAGKTLVVGAGLRSKRPSFSAETPCGDDPAEDTAVLVPVPEAGGEPDSCERPAVSALTRLFAVVESSERGVVVSDAAGAEACEMRYQQPVR